MDKSHVDKALKGYPLKFKSKRNLVATFCELE